MSSWTAFDALVFIYLFIVGTFKAYVKTEVIYIERSRKIAWFLRDAIYAFVMISDQYILTHSVMCSKKILYHPNESILNMEFEFFISQA